MRGVNILKYLKAMATPNHRDMIIEAILGLHKFTVADVMGYSGVKKSLVHRVLNQERDRLVVIGTAADGENIYEVLPEQIEHLRNESAATSDRGVCPEGWGITK